MASTPAPVWARAFRDLIGMGGYGPHQEQQGEKQELAKDEAGADR